jgi:hypothetical protein
MRCGALRHDGHQDNNRSGCVPAGAAVLQADVTGAIRQAFFTELAESNANFPRNDRAGIEYTVVDTEILRLMRHTDSGE